MMGPEWVDTLKVFVLCLLYGIGWGLIAYGVDRARRGR